MRVCEGNSGDVDLCGCEAYAELNDFNYQTASIEQSQAVVLACCDSITRTHTHTTHTHTRYILVQSSIVFIDLNKSPPSC